MTLNISLYWISKMPYDQLNFQSASYVSRISNKTIINFPLTHNNYKKHHVCCCQRRLLNINHLSNSSPLGIANPLYYQNHHTVFRSCNRNRNNLFMLLIQNTIGQEKPHLHNASIFHSFKQDQGGKD